jgi:hypothetical protein
LKPTLPLLPQVELHIRYLIHPKKARYVESIISSDILLAYKNGEIFTGTLIDEKSMKPLGEFQNGYTSPFIIKAFYKGMFNIDMGIITEMTFTKGKEGGWTKDCLPTVVDVSFTIQDLYSTLSLTPAGSLLKSNTMQNIAEMDYLANTCGVNINEPDVLRMVNMFVTFNIKNVFMDVPTNITTGLGNVLSNKISKIYQSFI